MNRPEPAAVAATVKELLSTVLKALVIFSLVKLTTEQFGILMILFDSVASVVMVLFVRSQVTPTANPQLVVGSTVNDGTSIVKPVTESDIAPNTLATTHPKNRIRPRTPRGG